MLDDCLINVTNFDIARGPCQTLLVHVFKDLWNLVSSDIEREYIEREIRGSFESCSEEHFWIFALQQKTLSVPSECVGMLAFSATLQKMILQNGPISYEITGNLKCPILWIISCLCQCKGLRDHPSWEDLKHLLQAWFHLPFLLPMLVGWLLYPGPVLKAAASPRNLLELQFLRPYPWIRNSGIINKTSSDYNEPLLYLRI